VRVSRRATNVPTVLSKREVQLLLNSLGGKYQLMAKLLYGSGLRGSECLRMRVKDLDFAHHQIVVRDGKGAKDRFTVLPESLVPALRQHLRRVKLLHQRDLRQGAGQVDLPYALERKYPTAGSEWIWQYVFPSRRRSANRRTGRIQRHHLSASGLRHAVREAAMLARIHKRVTRSTNAPPVFGRELPGTNPHWSHSINEKVLGRNPRAQPATPAAAYRRWAGRDIGCCVSVLPPAV